MTQIAYLDCHSGMSGDMFLAALLHAGLSLETLKNALSALPIDGYEIACEPFQDKGIGGMQCHVTISDEQQPHRHLSDIKALLHASALAPAIRERALAVFHCLAEAEATIHNSSIEEVHFHEVGAVDAIVDIVGAAVGIETLGITQLYASALPLTSGHVQTAHGLLPVPAPATLEILRRVAAPWKPCPVEGELVTPTGAALLASLARFGTPFIAIERVGYGFGHKHLPWPNCLRLCLGQVYGARSEEEADTDWVTVLESNIDTMSGELLGGVMERLLAAGALDVSYSPLQMKKNRPATLLTVICVPEQSDALAQILLHETGTLGVRMQQVQRLKAQRIQQHLNTPLGPITMKIKLLGERIISAAPEYDDCQRIARERDMPLIDVYEVVQHAIAATFAKETGPLLSKELANPVAQ